MAVTKVGDIVCSGPQDDPVYGRVTRVEGSQVWVNWKPELASTGGVLAVNPDALPPDHCYAPHDTYPVCRDCLLGPLDHPMPPEQGADVGHAQ